MSRFLLLFIFYILSTSVQGVIWEHTKVWSIESDKEFSQWIKSESVHKQIFVNKASSYYGIVADCADVSYAFRAIFAKEHGLPFKVLHPTGSRSGKKHLSNLSTGFDYIKNPKKRFVEFINYIGGSVGTEGLSLNDTYPIKIESVDAGSLFMYKVKASFGRAVRHSYNIKNVTPYGTFDVIYGTQAIAKEGLPLSYKKSQEMTKAPHRGWGFRNFKWPAHKGFSHSELPPYMNYSKEQYSLVRDLGTQGFFKYVIKILGSISEQTNDKVSRMLGDLCLASQDRIAYVHQGFNYNLKINGRCMNYTEFDTYSTPSRDQALKDKYLVFVAYINELKASGAINEIDPKIESFANMILTNDDLAYMRSDLRAFCPINFMESSVLDMATLWSRIKKKKLSSHPNDSIKHRWGEPTSSRITRCEQFY